MMWNYYTDVCPKSTVITCVTTLQCIVTCVYRCVESAFKITDTVTFERGQFLPYHQCITMNIWLTSHRHSVLKEAATV